MSSSAASQIIPFPQRRPTVSVHVGPTQAGSSQAGSSQAALNPAAGVSAADGRERLDRALASLQAALAEQRTALAAWRGSLAALRHSTEGLRDGLQRYHGTLGTLGEQVSVLRQEAGQLEAWADQVLQQDA
jgi:chromosome segregation ATPase